MEWDECFFCEVKFVDGKCPRCKRTVQEVCSLQHDFESESLENLEAAADLFDALIKEKP